MALPLVTLSQGELVALYFAEKVLAQYRGTPFEADLASAFRKIQDLLPGEVRVSPAQPRRLPEPRPRPAPHARRAGLPGRARRPAPAPDAPRPLPQPQQQPHRAAHASTPTTSSTTAATGTSPAGTRRASRSASSPSTASAARRSRPRATRSRPPSASTTTWPTPSGSRRARSRSPWPSASPRGRPAGSASAAGTRRPACRSSLDGGLVLHLQRRRDERDPALGPAVRRRSRGARARSRCGRRSPGSWRRPWARTGRGGPTARGGSRIPASGPDLA